MIEIRLRAAVSNPGSRRWRWGVSLAALVLAVVAPVATSRAQDASSSGATLADQEALRAMKVVTIDGGEAIAITSGAASITLKKDGTIVLKGTDIVIDGASNVRTRSTRASQMSEIF